MIQKNTSFIIGKNSVLEILKLDHLRVKEIFIAKNIKSGSDPIIDFAVEKKIPLHSTNYNGLTEKVGADSHQGYVAVVTKKKTLELMDLLKNKKERSLIVILDSIEDPGNFGAILRTAECFGVDGVIYSRNRGVSITPAVAKTSSGASEIVNIVEVGNLVQTCEKLQSEGYWIVATSLDSTAQSLYDFKFAEKTALILGSEGKGIQRLLLEKADFKVYIPLVGRIQSLNVAQAGAVFMNSYRANFASIDKIK